MRINRFIALATGMSRRQADRYIEAGHVKLNNIEITSGQQVDAGDKVTLNGKLLTLPATTTTILVNKPVGYVSSRDGQGSRTVYDLIPTSLHRLKPVGRLDKDSSGLLLMTNDGLLANKLTHPSFQKTKKYEIRLNRELTKVDYETITKQGVQLEDGVSKLKLDRLNDSSQEWIVIMHEGRNRQIRRTFITLGYNVQKLHRTHFGEYNLDDSLPDHYQPVNSVPTVKRAVHIKPSGNLP